jgi:hypothetical protein
LEAPRSLKQPSMGRSNILLSLLGRNAPSAAVASTEASTGALENPATAPGVSAPEQFLPPSQWQTVVVRGGPLCLWLLLLPPLRLCIAVCLSLGLLCCHILARQQSRQGQVSDAFTRPKCLPAAGPDSHHTMLQCCRCCCCSYALPAAVSPSASCTATYWHGWAGISPARAK